MYSLSLLDIVFFFMRFYGALWEFYRGKPENAFRLNILSLRKDQVESETESIVLNSVE